jgi:serine/threonine-protein kinase haspin
MIMIIYFIVFLLLQKKRNPLPSDLQKEKEYFEEVDAFELLEETPSPRKCTTWAMGAELHPVPHNLTTILARWGLSEITETSLENPVEKSLLPFFDKLAIEERGGEGEGEGEEEVARIETVKPHVVQCGLPVGEDEHLSAFTQLLMVCKQTAPVSLHEVLSAYWYTFILFE